MSSGIENAEMITEEILGTVPMRIWRTFITGA
jgi:hypothetical protein